MLKLNFEFRTNRKGFRVGQRLKRLLLILALLIHILSI